MKFAVLAAALALAGCAIEQPVAVYDPLQYQIAHERGVELGVLRARADEARIAEREYRYAEIHHQQQRDDADFATRLMLAAPKPTVVVTYPRRPE